MNIQDILVPEAVVPALAGDDKRAALAAIAEVGARIANLKARDVFAAVWEREQVGSTGIGRGIAVPHGRLAALQRMTCVFARTTRPIDYGSHDGQPVDLIFLLIGPEAAGSEHLKALARIARIMRAPRTVEALRSAADARTMYAVLTEPATADLSMTG